jgi:hypothetical protein
MALTGAAVRVRRTSKLTSVRKVLFQDNSQRFARKRL